MIAVSPSPSPETNHLHLPQSSSPAPAISFLTYSPSKAPVRFSPPLIAMVVIIATAFIAITYSRTISRRFLLLRRRWRQWRRRRRSYVPSSVGNGDIESPGVEDLNYDYELFSPYGLDDAVCFHAFHVDCIDIWLRCHANCPLCRSSVFRPPESSSSPFIPLMSARIRPNFDDVIIDNTTTIVEIEQSSIEEPDHSVRTEITQNISPILSQFDERFDRRNFLLKRSYSFGFERNIGSERLVIEPATASPWRYRRGSFWNKRPSPFSKSRVFSFRYHRGMKSPFFRRRTGSYTDSVTGNGGGSSSRRRKSFASPIFMRQSVMNSGMFSSSRLRSGDPEALLSPERYNRR